MKQRVILTVSNDIATDQRLHKVCTSLEKAGFSPLLVGRKKKNSLALEKRSYATERLPMWFEEGKLFYLELNLRLFFYLLMHRADIITANDLDTLLPCFLVSRLKGSKLVYDSHEYYTEVPELAHRPFEKKLWTLLERWIFPQLERVSTVGNSIANAYSQKYGVPVVVVRNMPSKWELNKEVGLKEKILIYQGAVNMGRGIELMMETMALLPEFTLWIIGDGPLWKRLKEEARTTPNVKFWGKLPFHELKPLTSQAMIGLSLEEDIGLNYRYALPNKIFDYVQSQVPIICSDLPEMRAIVEGYVIGEILKERTAHALAKVVTSMSQDEGRYLSYQANCRTAALELTWENAEPTLISLYQ